MEYGFYSYLIGAVGYLAVLLWSLPKINKFPLVVPFLIAFFFSLLWTGVTAFILYGQEYFVFNSLPYETLRNAAWYFLLAVLLSRQRYNNSYALLIDSRLAKVFIIFIVFIFCLEVSDDFRYFIKETLGVRWQIRLFAHLTFAICGLVLIEQLYRNAVAEQRWAIKFLCIGLGALFTVDFLIFSKSLLFLQLDFELWGARGGLNALIVPLLAIAVQRMQAEDFSSISLSRKIVFYTTAVLGTGVYLILMSLVGFYIKDFGGNWGGVAQITFIFLALLLLLILFFSGKIRAYFKVYIGKHFFPYQYDYRNEWIKLSKQIAGLQSVNELPGFIITTVMNLIDCSGGGIWIINEQGDYYLSEQKDLGFEPPKLIDGKQSLVSFLKQSKWVLDFMELAENPDVYADADLSAWTAERQKVWIILPLFFSNELEAIVILTRGKVLRKLNWEDHDFLKTVGLQLVNALALGKTSDALAKSKQFEAYSRISAYLVHDLKNLVTQVGLIVKNAEKHKHNREFIDDSIETLRNVVHKIDHILAQLKKGDVANSPPAPVNVLSVLEDVVVQQLANKPAPEIVCQDGNIEIVGEKQKLVAIFGHLVQNAQEATSSNGFVKLELAKDQDNAIVKIIDNGCGMDEKFIAERLFKPFDTTKGNAGMGIGVYEAREYITLQGGTCKVESQLGVGTCFTVILPLRKN